MENKLEKGKKCIGQKVIDTDGNEGIIIDFFVENGKKSKVIIKYLDGTEHIREKHAVQKGSFRKPYLDDIEQCLKTTDWKYIPGFNQRYIISKTGQIKSAIGINKGKLLSPSCDTNGYNIITLQVTDRNNRQLCRVHRLVVETFIRKPEKNEEVNHINGNKQDNSLSNLEIFSRKSNNKKYLDLLEWGLSETDIKKIEKYCLENNITIKEYIVNNLKGE